MTATKDQSVKAEKLSAQAKAQQTTSVAKTIIAAETEAREKKTERLKALRMAKTQE